MCIHVRLYNISYWCPLPKPPTFPWMASCFQEPCSSPEPSFCFDCPTGEHGERSIVANWAGCPAVPAMPWIAQSQKPCQWWSGESYLRLWASLETNESLSLWFWNVLHCSTWDLRAHPWLLPWTHLGCHSAAVVFTCIHSSIAVAFFCMDFSTRSRALLLRPSRRQIARTCRSYPTNGTVQLDRSETTTAR